MANGIGNSDLYSLANNAGSVAQAPTAQPMPQNSAYQASQATDAANKAAQGVQGIAGGSATSLSSAAGAPPQTGQTVNPNASPTATGISAGGPTQFNYTAGMGIGQQGMLSSGAGALQQTGQTANPNAPITDNVLSTSQKTTQTTTPVQTQPQTDKVIADSFANIARATAEAMQKTMAPQTGATIAAQQQKMAENGITGANASAMTDRTQALANTQMANAAEKLQLSAMQATIDQEAKMQLQDQQNAVKLLEATAGDDVAFGATIQDLVQRYPDNQTFKQLAENPETARAWREAFISGKLAERQKYAGQVINTITDFRDPAAVNARFADYVKAKTGGSLSAYNLMPSTYQPSAEDVTNWVNATGANYSGDDLDRKEVYLYNQYKKEVAAVAAQSMNDEVLKDLQTGGVDVNDFATMNAIKGMSGILSKELDNPVTMGNLTAMFDGDTVNGNFSHLFTDWTGQPYAQGATPDPVDKKLDAMWENYVRANASAGTKPMPRMQWASQVAYQAAQTGNVQALPDDYWKQIPSVNERLSATYGKSGTDLLKSATDTTTARKAIAAMNPADISAAIADPATKSKLLQQGVYAVDLSNYDLNHNTTRVVDPTIGELTKGQVVFKDGKPYIFDSIDYGEKQGSMGSRRESHGYGYTVNPDGSQGQRIELWGKADDSTWHGGLLSGKLW